MVIIGWSVPHFHSLAFKGGWGAAGRSQVTPLRRTLLCDGGTGWPPSVSCCQGPRAGILAARFPPVGHIEVPPHLLPALQAHLPVQTCKRSPGTQRSTGEELLSALLRAPPGQSLPAWAEVPEPGKEQERGGGGDSHLSLGPLLYAECRAGPFEWAFPGRPHSKPAGAKIGTSRWHNAQGRQQALGGPAGHGLSQVCTDVVRFSPP